MSAKWEVSDSVESNYLIQDSPELDYRRVVESLVGGVSISVVDPAVFPHILPYLQRSIESNRELGDGQVVKDLEDCVRYIERKLRRREVSDLGKAPLPLNDEIEGIARRIIEEDEVGSYRLDQIPLIIECLRRRCVQFIEAKQYANAARADHFSRVLVAQEQLDLVEDVQSVKASELQERLVDARANLEATKKKWKDLHRRMRTARDTESSQMEDEHDKQISEIQQLFKAEPPAELRKYSAALIQLRCRE
jgi:hypothetical protein